MPTLSAVLNDADYTAADDSLKTFYVQNTETKDWWLSVDEPGKLDVAGQKTFKNLKEKLDGAFKERDAAKKLAESFEKFGKSPEELQAALEANRPEEVTKMVADYETKFENLKKSFEEPLATANERAKKLEALHQQSLAASAIAKLQQDFELNDTAPYVLRDFIKVIPQEDGSDGYAVKVFENGSPKQIAGQDVTPDQLIKSFIEAKKFPAMFNAGTGGGTGAQARQSAGAGAGSIIRIPREESKTNPALYSQAKETAAKTGAQIQFTD